jgi:hypothetical protein
LADQAIEQAAEDAAGWLIRTFKHKVRVLAGWADCKRCTK